MREPNGERRAVALDHRHVGRLDRDDRRTQAVRYEISSGNRRGTVGRSGTARHLPGHREVVAAAAFLLQRFDVITKAVGQRYGGGLLRCIRVPFARVSPGGHRSNLDFVRWIFVRAQVKNGVVVAGNPEDVAARHRRYQQRAHPLAIVVGEVGGRFKGAFDKLLVGTRRKFRCARQVRDRVAVDVVVHLPHDTIGLGQCADRE